MQLREFTEGTVLYGEGENTDRMYRVVAGTAEAFRVRVGAGRSVVARLEAGQVFGAMNQIRGGQIGVGVVAATDLTVEEYSSDEFDAAVQTDAALAYAVVTAMWSRMSYVLAKLSDARSEADHTQTAALSDFVIRPGSPWLARQMQAIKIPAKKLPFVVGSRNPRFGTTANLGLIDTSPPILSMEHFAIESWQGRLLVRDMGSNRGTVVNGVDLGKQSGTFGQPLENGENEILAGGAGSPFRFLVEL